jgi:hypothetical protein
MNKNTIIFNVEYLNCRWIKRKIELLESNSLDDLYKSIIHVSFRWDDPHMYSFFMDNIPFSRDANMEYSCNPKSLIEIDGIMRKSTKTKLRELNLKEGKKFVFIFDFGDKHRFRITVEGFSEAKEGIKYPVILEQKGKSPKQYEDFDEDE